MSDFFKELEKKYYIFSAIILVLIIGQTVPNISVNFFFATLWEAIIIPLIIITFWDNFMRHFPSTSSEPPKIRKPHMITFVVVFYTVLFNHTMYMYLADIPSAINKEYTTVEGSVSYLIVNKNIRTKQFFELNHTLYSIRASDFIKMERYENYKVTVLKNSRFVLEIKKIE